MPHIAVVLATMLALGICVIFQYEALVLVWRRLSRHQGHRRAKVLYGIISVIALHFVQICVFGVTLWLLLRWPATGSLAGAASGAFLDCVYLSSITFSTVGFGDIAPSEMEKFWRAQDMKANLDS